MKQKLLFIPMYPYVSLCIDRDGATLKRMTRSTRVTPGFLEPIQSWYTVEHIITRIDLHKDDIYNIS